MRIVVILLVFICILKCSAADPELKLLNIIFRHGDRTPTESARFPTDPHYNSDFYPYGLGALTSSGKSRIYKFGELLREKYRAFLGDVYLPELLEARSTDYDRTKMSLQLVLAALFPPSNLQKWHDTINWQPISTTYVPKTKDDLLGTTHQAAFLAERERAAMEKDIQERTDKLRDFMIELSYLTGKNISNSLGIKRIYETLVAESYMNLTLPAWSENALVREKLYEGILLDYAIISHDDDMTRTLIGKLMTKITTDMLSSTNNMTSRTKLHLYSGHEVNIVGVLSSLNLYRPHVPQYSSAVLMELFKENQKFYVKITYYQGIPSTFVELQIPGCPTLCPIDNYLSTMKNILEPVQIK